MEENGRGVLGVFDNLLGLGGVFVNYDRERWGRDEIALGRFHFSRMSAEIFIVAG